MSVFWYVDERSRPARFEANVSLILLRRPGLYLPPTMASTLRRGLDFWNTRVDTINLSSGRPAVIRYRFRIRHARGRELNPPGLQDAVDGGKHGAATMETWVEHHNPEYRAGFGVILYGGRGAGEGTSEAQRSIVHYTMAGAGQDLGGAFVLAHELGHILGLRDRYYPTDHDPTPDDGTRSHEGWEGNLMADLYADRARGHGVWLGWTQLSGVCTAAATAAGPSGRATRNDSDYFGAPWALKERVARP